MSRIDRQAAGTLSRYAPAAKPPSQVRAWCASMTPRSRRRVVARCAVSFATPSDAASDRTETAAMNPSASLSDCSSISSSTIHADAPTRRRSTCAAGPNTTRRRLDGSVLNGHLADRRGGVAEPHDSTRRRQLRQRPPRHARHCDPRRITGSPDVPPDARYSRGQLIPQRPTDPQHLGRLGHRQQGAVNVRFGRHVMLRRRHSRPELHT